MRNILDETISMEKFVIKILENKFKNLTHSSLTDPQCDYDIVADTKLLDVKHAAPTMISHKKRLPIWSFDLGKGVRKYARKTYLDFYVCVGLKNNTPKRVFMIPFEIAPKRHLRISVDGSSKWNSYIIWEL